MATPSSIADLSAKKDTAATRAVPQTKAVRMRPGLCAIILIFSDLAALLISGIASFLIRAHFDPTMNPRIYWGLAPIWALFIAAYALVKLYPVVGLSPVEELRRASLATTTGYWGVAAATFVLRGDEIYSRAVFFMAWVLTIVLQPLLRSLVRAVFARREWWGYPVVVLGAGRAGQQVFRSLLRQPELGLKPVALLDDSHPSTSATIPVLGGLDLAPKIAAEANIHHAIVAMPGVPPEKLLELLEKHAHTFPHLIVIPDLFGFSSLHVPVKDLGGILGLELRQQLLLLGPRVFKRATDLLITIIGGIAILPFVLLLMILIKLDSRGPVFYAHTRLGRGGKHFRAWKFRSMHRDAAERLEHYLAEHPELREEWASTQKLRNDPRITRIGKLLRKTSLDELPQLWNIFLGDMSLVGPRPIVDNEVPRYGNSVQLYLKVRPGLTGLWQVSGRNDTTYEERVALDTYYVRNWSPWLDIHILARTVIVVITAKGAY